MTPPDTITLSRCPAGFAVELRRPFGESKPATYPTLEEALEVVLRVWGPPPAAAQPVRVVPAQAPARAPLDDAVRYAPAALLARSVDRLEGILPQTRAALHEVGLGTVAALVERSARELMELPGIGRISVRDVESALARVGLSLRKP